MQGKKTHEQQVRILERKPDYDSQPVTQGRSANPDKEKRHSEFPVSRRGMSQESQHNKHND